MIARALRALAIKLTAWACALELREQLLQIQKVRAMDDGGYSAPRRSYADEVELIRLEQLAEESPESAQVRLAIDVAQARIYRPTTFVRKLARVK